MRHLVESGQRSEPCGFRLDYVFADMSSALMLVIAYPKRYVEYQELVVIIDFRLYRIYAACLISIKRVLKVF